MSLSRISVSLCCTSGWSTTVRCSGGQMLGHVALVPQFLGDFLFRGRVAEGGVKRCARDLGENAFVPVEAAGEVLVFGPSSWCGKNGGSSVETVTFTPPRAEFFRSDARATTGRRRASRSTPGSIPSTIPSSASRSTSARSSMACTPWPIRSGFSASSASRTDAAPTPFARMHRDAKPRLPRAVEGPQKIARLPLHLVARHPEAHQPVASRLGRAFRDRFRAVRAEMADAGDDAPQRDAKVALGRLRRLADGVEVVAPRVHISAAAEIGAEERLGINDAVFRAFLQNGAGQAGVVLGRLQDARRRLVDRQEMPEIAVGVAAVLPEDAREVDAPSPWPARG